MVREGLGLSACGAAGALVVDDAMTQYNIGGEVVACTRGTEHSTQLHCLRTVAQPSHVDPGCEGGMAGRAEAAAQAAQEGPKWSWTTMLVQFVLIYFVVQSAGKLFVGVQKGTPQASDADDVAPTKVMVPTFLPGDLLVRCAPGKPPTTG